jgi:hypothetical protein
MGGIAEVIGETHETVAGWFQDAEGGEAMKSADGKKK